MRRPTGTAIFISLIAILIAAELLVRLILGVLAPGLGGLRWLSAHIGLLLLLATPGLAWLMIGVAPKTAEDRPHLDHHITRFNMFLAGAVAALGVALSVLHALQTRREIDADTADRFELNANVAIDSIEKAFDNSASGLRTVSGLYAASDVLEAHEFAAYVATRDLPHEFPGAVLFGVLRPVAHTDIEKFAFERRADGQAGYQPLPAPDVVQHYFVQFAEPAAVGIPLLGLDAVAWPGISDAITRAIDAKRPMLANAASLPIESGETSVAVWVLPLYRNGAPTSTPEERRAALAHIAFAVVAPGVLLDVVEHASVGQLTMALYDGENPREGEPLAGRASPDLDDDQGFLCRADFPESSQVVFTELHVGGRPFTVAIASTDLLDAGAGQSAAWLWGIGGSVLSLALGGLIWVLCDSRAHAQRLAHEMTRDLRRLSVIAERTSNAVIVTDAAGRTTWVNEAFEKLAGYTLDEFRGQFPGRLLQFEGSDPAAIAAMHRAVQDGTSCRVEIANRGKSGNIYVLDIDLQPLRDERGSLTGFMAIETDVTESKRAQQRLGESEARFRALADAVPMLVWLAGTDKKCYDFNKGWLEFTGRTLEQERGDGWVEGVHPDDMDGCVRTYVECFDARKPFVMTYRLRRHDGVYRWIEDRGVPRYAADGSFLGYAGGCMDVTEQIEAKELLAASEARFRTLVEGINVIVWEFNPASDSFTYVSPQAAQLGYPIAQWLEPGFWKERLHPDDRERAIEFCASESAGGRDHRFQYRMFRADGTAVWIDDSVHVEMVDGRVAMLRGVMFDISEQVAQKQAMHLQAERLDLTLSAANLGTWDWNVRTGEVAFNENWCRMLGYEPSEIEPDVSVWKRLVHPEDMARVTATLEDHLESRAKEYRCEHRLRRKDGTWAWVLDIGRVMERDAEGKPLRAVGVHMDISEIRAAQDAAEAANRAKSDFLANMSHEIRTPMTAILGYTDLLAEDGDRSIAPRQRLEYIDTIRRNGDHLLSIINDILDISKIEAGRMSVEKMPTDPLHLFREVESLMRVRAKAKGIALDLEQETPIPVSIASDPLRLRQVLVNLIGNAIKFTEIGGVTVRIGLDAHAAAGPLLRVEIADTGIGMTPEQRQRLFLPFSQADTSVTRKFGGTGLGLRISKSLAEMLGGDISVSSEPGKGSVFTLTISTGPVEGLAMLPMGSLGREVKAESPQAAAPALPLAGLRIFFAEDGPDNQRLISHMLRKAGAEVKVFDNGKLALEALTLDHTVDGDLASPPPCDILLSDMQMPEMDGYTLVGTLRAKGWMGPIIALTAHAMTGDAEKCIAAGCDHFATKPIDKAKLVEVCRRASEESTRQRSAA
ncbi:MAG: PAS domain-containing protein [Phycisphaerales bacterium]|nr:PAS domain-containing protein [Phycisphaerales bacterium]